MTDQPFIPYGRQDISEDDIAAVSKVLRSDYLTTGPEVERFETAFAAQTGASTATVCNSGTAALHLATLAAGLGPGDWAIVPAITFLATANAVRMTGAEVQFADVDPDTGLLTIEAAEKALKACPGKPKAILPVHMGGQPTDPALYDWAKQQDLTVIADSCHGLGGWCHSAGSQTHPIGSCVYEDIATFSLHPVKSVAMGEGGMITTNHPDLAHRMKTLRNHGMQRDPGRANSEPWAYEMQQIGYNYRAPDILCALGRSQLKRLPAFQKARAERADVYDVAFADLSSMIKPVPRVAYAQSGWHLYRLIIDFEALGITRGDFMGGLKKKGIGSQVHYIPVSSQPYYQNRYGEQDLPGADQYYCKTLSIPLYASLTEQDQNRVIEAVKTLL